MTTGLCASMRKAKPWPMSVRTRWLVLNQAPFWERTEADPPVGLSPARFALIMGGTHIGWSWARGTSIERNLMKYDVAPHDLIEHEPVTIEGGDSCAQRS